MSRSTVRRLAYAMYGLTIESELPLDGGVAEDGSRPDLTILRGEPQTDSPDGELIAGDPDGLLYRTLETGTGYAVHVPGVCTFHIDAGLDRAVCDVYPDADEGVAAILAAGNLVATILGLKGEATLHASAVRLSDGRCIAFAARSGMGKSTLAALLCADGATLVGDDMLRLPQRDGRFYPIGGATQIRLRPQAAEIADRFPARQRTVDERIAVTPDRAGDAPLTAVILPRPSRTQASVETRRLSQAEAAAALVACSRILGWRLKAPMQAHLSLAARLARSVPVLEANIPWGPPFPPDLARDILERL